MSQYSTAGISIRSIDLSELEAFTSSVTTSPQQADQLRHHLLALFESGDSHPTWCVVAEQQGQVVAALACRSVRVPEPSVRIVELHLPSSVDSQVGGDLLRFALWVAYKEGWRVFVRNLEPGAKNLDAQVAAFEQLGASLVRATVRYVWPGGNLPPARDRLTFRAVSEGREDILIEAMARSLGGSLDQLMQREAAERGGAQLWAEEEYRSWVTDYDVQPGWWELAYDEQGALVGLILPARLTPEEGTVVYVAVLPEFRGASYGLELLMRGTRTLLESGLSTILLDTDVLNLPTQRLNETAGYQRQGIVRRYQLDLNELFDATRP